MIHIRMECGIPGVFIVEGILDNILQGEGYWITFDPITLAYAHRVEVEELKQAVDSALRCGFFNRAMFDRFGILTADWIQEIFYRATTKRKDRGIDFQFWLLNDDAQGVSDAETRVSGAETTPEPELAERKPELMRVSGVETRVSGAETTPEPDVNQGVSDAETRVSDAETPPELDLPGVSDVGSTQSRVEERRVEKRREEEDPPNPPRGEGEHKRKRLNRGPVPSVVDLTFPEHLRTPKVLTAFSAWIDTRARKKAPARPWKEFFQNQIELILDPLGEDDAVNTLTFSAGNDYQGLVVRKVQRQEPGRRPGYFDAAIG